MSAFRSVTQGFKNLWGQGGDDEYEDVAEELEETPRSSHRAASQPRDIEPETESDTAYSTSRPASVRSSDFRSSASSSGTSSDSERFPRYTTPPASAFSGDRASTFSSNSSSGAHKTRLAPMPLRSREKNIYTLKPKSMDEASLAADYLKTGCAVVLNLEEVERTIAIRIIDFMSGVCYGLEHQGHAMKLGEVIFLFTPGEFEISSDETDYGENRDILFKDVHPEKPKLAARPEELLQAVAERRSWER